MTTTAALAAQTIDLDGYYVKITERSYSGADRSFYSKDRSWRITTGIRTFDYEITRNDGHVEVVNSARSIKEIYAAAGRFLRSIIHTLPASRAPKMKVGDIALAYPESTPIGIEGQVLADHPVAGLVWLIDIRTGKIHAAVRHEVDVFEEYAKPTRKALAEQESLAINV